MQATDLDPSLAYTALRELDPGHNDRTWQEYGERRDALLAAWYAQDDIRNLMDFTRAWLTWVPVGTKVRYHSRVFTVTGYSDLTLRKDLPAEAIKEAYPAGEAYDLWPDGVPRKFANRDQGWFHVRRKSFTPITEEEAAAS
jgi:hypothetical protein